RLDHLVHPKRVRPVRLVAERVVSEDLPAVRDQRRVERRRRPVRGAEPVIAPGSKYHQDGNRQESAKKGCRCQIGAQAGSADAASGQNAVRGKGRGGRRLRGARGESRSRRAAGACRNSHGSSLRAGWRTGLRPTMQRRFEYIKNYIDLLHKSSPDGRLGRLLAATRWRVSALLRYRLCEREGCDVMTGRPLVDAQAELGD